MYKQQRRCSLAVPLALGLFCPGSRSGRGGILGEDKDDESLHCLRLQRKGPKSKLRRYIESAKKLLKTLVLKSLVLLTIVSVPLVKWCVTIDNLVNSIFANQLPIQSMLLELTYPSLGTLIAWPVSFLRSCYF
jgi:hypothetical protein